MTEQDLRERLGAVHVPPSRLDTETVLMAGRRAGRRRTARAVAGAVLAVGALVAVPSVVFGARGTPDVAPAAPRSTTCAVTGLPVPAGMNDVLVSGIDPAGRYITGFNTTEEAGTNRKTGKVDGLPAAQPVLWVDGRPQRLLGSYRSVIPSGVNTAGVVAAVAGNGKTFDTVLRYVAGTPQKLTTPAGRWSFNQGVYVNAAGDIAAADDQRGVLLWKAGSTTAAKLPLPAHAMINGLSDDGRIIGAVVTADGQTLTSYLWTQTGTASKFVTPDGQQMSVSAARGEWVTGNVWPSGTAVRWNTRTGQFTDLKLHTPAHGINAQGWVLADDTIERPDAPALKLEHVAGDDEPPFAGFLSDPGLAAGNRLTSDKDGHTVSKGVITWNCADRK
ncbi:hypothetical protein [Paractinoplanes toevensis]|uniref:Uncharacterized protein n=1 Tax=Paractinoplanes toevensis TaxID=571911 RepID=A0A920BRB5_9ACTN|nr:hypothetical protein [Actinoplanes toevensis]GIM97875.1 hypothetical protein Ato02nite_096680 [Actinoplanes toevensis]